MIFSNEKEENESIQKDLDAAMYRLIKETDGRYAIKVVEWIVFGMVALILSGFIGALLFLVFAHPVTTSI